MRRRPYAVILFDEIEKAHPDVWNVLLQVLDDGRLTDGQGRTVDFTNTVIVLTSNVGSQHIQNVADEKEMRSLVMEDLRRAFRPEFLNRLDETVLFHRLSKEDVRQIVDVQLGRFGARAAKRDLHIEVTDRAKDFLANAGFDPIYGARPLKRAIQQHLENPLAAELLGGKFAPGETLEVDASGGNLVFTAKGTAEGGPRAEPSGSRATN